MIGYLYDRFLSPKNVRAAPTSLWLAEQPGPQKAAANQIAGNSRGSDAGGQISGKKYFCRHDDKQFSIRDRLCAEIS